MWCSHGTRNRMRWDWVKGSNWGIKILIIGLIFFCNFTFNYLFNFSIKAFFSKCNQIRSFLRIWSRLLKKSLMENIIFCAVTEDVSCMRFQVSPNIWLTIALREKCLNAKFFLVRIFVLFELNTDIYSVNLRIQSEYGKIRTRKDSVFGHFSHSVDALG